MVHFCLFVMMMIMTMYGCPRMKRSVVVCLSFIRVRVITTNTPKRRGEVVFNCMRAVTTHLLVRGDVRCSLIVCSCSW